MKAFLSSGDLTQKQIMEFQKLLGTTKVAKALFVSSAAVPYGLEPRPKWLESSIKEMGQFAEEVDETSLENGMPANLDKYGFIFISGGNVFYLAYRLSETGFDKLLKKYIEGNAVYAGSSAGAIILMDDIQPFEPADDPKAAPRIYSGLGVLKYAIVPHADNEKYKPIMKGIAQVYGTRDLEVVLLNDDQVLIVNGDEKEIV